MSLATGKSIEEVEQWPSTLLTEWAAHERISPFFCERIDYGFAALQSFIGNMLGGKKDEPPPFEIRDFIPIWGLTEEEAEELKGEREEEAENKRQDYLTEKTKGIFDQMMAAQEEPQRTITKKM